MLSTYRLNYSRNDERFVQNRDYHLLSGEDLKLFKSNLPNDIGVVDKRTPSLYLWTERGANRHCKILDTDKACQSGIQGLGIDAETVAKSWC